MNDAQTKTNKNSTIKFQCEIPEDQTKDLQIHQLSNELNNAKEDIKRLISSTPDIENLYKKINEANDKNHSLECTISSLKTRVKQLQAKNNELKEQIQINTKNCSIQISKNQNQIAQQQKELTDFFHNLSQIAGKTFSSFNDVVQFIKSDNSTVTNNDSKLEKLKAKNKKIKNSISIIKEEKSQIQAKLKQVLSENEELNIAANQNYSVIESLRQNSQKLEKKIESNSFLIEKLKQKNQRLKNIIKDVTDKNFDINEPRIIQLQQFLQQKTDDFESLNNQLSTLNNEKAELERQNTILFQKGREYLSFKQIAQKEISKLKMTLTNNEEERKLLMDKISRIELENASLISQVQTTNQKCILLKAQIQEMETESRNAQSDQNEFNGMVKIFEKVIESQKNDLMNAISSRNLLAERILKQNYLLSKEEELLSKQIEQNKILRSKLSQNNETRQELYTSNQNKFFEHNNAENYDQNSGYLLLGYIKELLLPEIPVNYQSNLLSMLDNSSLSVVQRVKQVFRFVISNQFSTTQQFQYKNQTNDSKNKQKIIKYLKINDNIDINSILSQILMYPDISQVINDLISTIEKKDDDLQKLKQKMKSDMKTIEEIVTTLGFDNVIQMKNYFGQLKQKCSSTEEKLKEYRDIARVFKAELQKKMNEIDNLKSDKENTVQILKKEINKLKTKITQLKKESDDLRLKVQNAINETEKEKQKSINDLNEQRIKYDAIINKINANSTNEFTSTKVMISDIQKKYEIVEQRYQKELNLLKNQIEEQNKIKNEITIKYQKQADESEQMMNELVKKLDDSRVKIEKLKKENSQLRLEKKALEFQLEVHSNHGTCFATMLEETHK